MRFAGLLAFWVLCFQAAAWAQDGVTLDITDDPRGYALDFLERTTVEHMEPIRAWADRSGVALDRAFLQGLSHVESSIPKDATPVFMIIEELESGGAMRQIYGYTHLGGVMFLFWKFEFRAVHGGWAVKAISFNDDYEQILRPTFHTTRPVGKP